MHRMLCVCATAMLLPALLPASVIHYQFTDGTGVNSPLWPSSSGLGNTTGLSLGTTTLGLDDPTDAGLNALLLVGSNTLYCVSDSSTPAAGNCAGAATNNAPGSNGHASGIGVGDARIDGSDAITVTVLPGYVARLISFSLTALYDVTGEDASYEIDDGGPVIVDASSNPIETIAFANVPFLKLEFLVAPQAGDVPNTYALHSLQVDIEAVPEPATFVLIGAGLLTLGVASRRLARR